VSPATGSGSTQSFTFTFTDPNGYSDLQVLDVLVNNYLDGIGACYLAFVPQSSTSGYLYLVDDAGDGGYVAGTPLLFPSGSTLHNSQCSIIGSSSSMAASGDTLTLTLDIAFAPGFAGNKIVYMAARTSTLNSGWQALRSQSRLDRWFRTDLHVYLHRQQWLCGFAGAGCIDE
jgi:hypothetical protein